MPAASVVLGLVLVAAPAAYCAGQPITSESGVPRYPNGQRVVDAGDILYPGGSAVKSATGQVRYPNGQQTRTATGTCYFETGVEMNPCQRVVAIRERLPGGEIAFYQLDIVAGAIDLRQARYEFAAGSALITLAADLTTGRLDRASIGAVCSSGVSSR